MSDAAPHWFGPSSGSSRGKGHPVMFSMVRRPLRLVRVYGITTGCGYAIRAWSVFEKEGGPLLATE